MIAIPIGKAIFQGRERPLIFLLRDDFTTAAAAPLTTPRTAEPGPGTLVITDTTNKLSIVAGKLTWAGAGAGAGNPGVWGEQLARVVGRAVVGNSNKTAGGIEIGWDITQSGSAVDVFRNSAGSSTLVLENGVAVVGEVPANSTDYAAAVIMRTVGNFYILKGGVFTTWTMIWVGDVSTGVRYATATAGGTTATGTVSFLRVTDLPAPFTDNYGLATQRLAGARSGGDTFIHIANCLLEYIVTTLPSALAITFEFRRQDASNYWTISVDSVGTISLTETVAGVPTVRGTAVTVVANGHRVVVMADGSTIRIYSNHVLRFTYSSASNFATSTAGVLSSLGTGGAVSDIVSWPRVLTGAAAALLDAAAA